MARSLASATELVQLNTHIDVPYCLVDGRVVFLDVRHDCYFRLSEQVEQAFLLWLKERQAPFPFASMLIERGVITCDPSAAAPNVLTIPETPLQSALETTPARTPISFQVVLEVAYLVALTRTQLAIYGLHRISRSLSSYRERRARSNPTSDTPPTSRLMSAAASFRRARHFVPITSRCLLDSLSLARFLANRSLHANVVFGVMGDPFAAHCWVQSGQLALNETVGDAEAFTPIWMI